MQTQLIMFVSLMTFFIILSFVLDNINTLKERRKQQVTQKTKDSILKHKLEQAIDQRTSLSKRRKLEILSIQAGHEMSYTSFILLSILSSILLSFAMFFLSNNIILAFVFLIFGYVLPNQLLTFKRNKRVFQLEQQIGPFLKIVIERYDVLKNMGDAISQTKSEFKGQEPMYDFLVKTDYLIKSGKPVSESLDYLGEITENKFLKRFTKYYNIVARLGTEESRRNILTQAFAQYEEDRKLKLKMRKALSKPKSDAFILIATVPLFAVYQVFTSDGYIAFMTQTTMGQIGTAVVTIVLMFALWFTGKFIGRPLD